MVCVNFAGSPELRLRWARLEWAWPRELMGKLSLWESNTCTLRCQSWLESMVCWESSYPDICFFSELWIGLWLGLIFRISSSFSSFSFSNKP